VIASADDPVAFLRKLHHFHITLAIRYFERPGGGRSVNRIQVVSRGHVINDDILPLRTDIQVATDKPSVRAGDPTVQKETYIGDCNLRIFFSFPSQLRDILSKNRFQHSRSIEWSTYCSPLLRQ
jgi:hypothetical protein